MTTQTPIPRRLPTAASLTIRPPADPIDWLEATALVHDYVEWLRAAVGVEPLDAQPALADELADLAAQYDGRRSILFIAHLDRLAVGTVALRIDDEGRAELKRMYLRPVSRGLGLADRLLERAIAEAVSQGCHTMWLETLTGVMEPALAVYRRNGFTDAPDGSHTIPVDGMVTLARPLGPDRSSGRR